MKTTVERVDDTTVKLSITVEAARVDEAIAGAARELASQVRIPGFRPGRAPRRVLESRLGKGALLDEAARDSLPQFYSEAIESEDLPVVGLPSFDVETFIDGQDAEFTATVEVRPTFDVPDYRSLQVPYPDWEVTDEEVNAQLDALRERFAEVETVTRPARVGDLVTVTVNAERAGQRIDEASVEDALHEVVDPESGGSELDRQLIGASAGAILRFHETLGEDAGELAGATINYMAIVKQAQQKVLPALDDDFAITASEYDTLDELRADVRGNLERQKRAYARQALRGKVVEAVSDLVDVTLPAAMVQSEQRYRLQRLAQQAEAYGLEVDQYLEAAGGEGFLADLESDARATVKAQLVVDRIGRELGIEVSQSDLGEEIGRQAARLGRQPDELARLMTSSPERLSALVGDTFRRKTIDAIVDDVEVLGGPPEEEPADEVPAEEPAEAGAEAD